MKSRAGIYSSLHSLLALGLPFATNFVLCLALMARVNEIHHVKLFSRSTSGRAVNPRKRQVYYCYLVLVEVLKQSGKPPFPQPCQLSRLSPVVRRLPSLRFPWLPLQIAADFDREDSPSHFTEGQSVSQRDHENPFHNFAEREP
jgi:hypothetical protein